MKKINIDELRNSNEYTILDENSKYILTASHVQGMNQGPSDHYLQIWIKKTKLAHEHIQWGSRFSWREDFPKTIEEMKNVLIAQAKMRVHHDELEIKHVEKRLQKARESLSFNASRIMSLSEL